MSCNRLEMEQTLGLELPSAFEKYSLETQELIVKYLTQLNPWVRRPTFHHLQPGCGHHQSSPIHHHPHRIDHTSVQSLLKDL